MSNTEKLILLGVVVVVAYVAMKKKPSNNRLTGPGAGNKLDKGGGFNTAAQNALGAGLSAGAKAAAGAFDSFFNGSGSSAADDPGNEGDGGDVTPPDDLSAGLADASDAGGDTSGGIADASESFA